MRRPQTNGFVERFNRTLQGEFLRTAMRTTLYTSTDALQADLDTWLVHYNEERPHRGYRNIGYLRNNAAFVDYPRYLALGFPIATGVIEGACRHLVKDRMGRAGMKWTQRGAQVLLDLLAVRVNGDWGAYHRHAAHARRYGSSATPIDVPETAVFAIAAPSSINAFAPDPSARSRSRSHG